MEGYFGPGFCGNMQHKLWNLVENPNSSFAAKVNNYFDLNFLTYIQPSTYYIEKMDLLIRNVQRFYSTQMNKSHQIIRLFGSVVHFTYLSFIFVFEYSDSIILSTVPCLNYQK